MKVTVFSTTRCAYCSMVKKFLSTKGIQYQEVNIEEDPQAAQKAQKLSGALTVPITLVEQENGKQSVIVGYNPMKLATI